MLILEQGCPAFVTADLFHFNSKLSGMAGALQTAEMWQGCLKAQTERSASIWEWTTYSVAMYTLQKHASLS